MLNDIVALNNQAISFLRKEESNINNNNREEGAAKAIAHLYEAIRRIRKRFPHLKEKKKSKNGEEDDELNSKQETSSSILHRPIKRRKENNQTSLIISKISITEHYHTQQQQQPRRRSAPSATSNNSENLFNFYQEGFIMMPPTTEHTLDSDDDNETNTNAAVAAEQLSLAKQKLTTQIYIVLLYNMGLALQKDGIMCNTSSSKPGKLRKALKVYELAMAIISIHWTEIDAENLLLMLALSNNLGHIHSHLLNFAETQKYLVWLRHLMKVFQQCNKKYGTRSIISDQDYSFFFTNSLVFLENLKELSCAPTA